MSGIRGTAKEVAGEFRESAVGKTSRSRCVFLLGGMVYIYIYCYLLWRGIYIYIVAYCGDAYRK